MTIYPCSTSSRHVSGSAMPYGKHRLTVSWLFLNFISFLQRLKVLFQLHDNNAENTLKTLLCILCSTSLWHVVGSVPREVT